MFPTNQLSTHHPAVLMGEISRRSKCIKKHVTSRALNHVFDPFPLIWVCRVEHLLIYTWI